MRALNCRLGWRNFAIIIVVIVGGSEISPYPCKAKAALIMPTSDILVSQVPKYNWDIFEGTDIDILRFRNLITFWNSFSSRGKNFHHIPRRPSINGFSWRCGRQRWLSFVKSYIIDREIFFIHDCRRAPMINNLVFKTYAISDLHHHWRVFIFNIICTYEFKENIGSFYMPQGGFGNIDRSFHMSSINFRTLPQ